MSRSAAVLSLAAALLAALVPLSPRSPSPCGASDLDPTARREPIPLYTSAAVYGELERLLPWTLSLFDFHELSGMCKVSDTFALSSFPLVHGSHTVGFRVWANGCQLAYVCDV